jgi:transposase
MMGIKIYEEKLFYNFSLTKRIPENHILKKIAKIIDFHFVRKLTKDYYSHTGQPSIDPVVLFKMMLIGYLYGITSERRLAEEISLNLAYMWFLGYDIDEQTPHHSVISKARARYGKEVFKEFFQEVLRLCLEAGLIDGEKVYIDSTLVKANASLKSAVNKEILRLKYRPQEYINKVFEENPVEEEKQVSEDKQREIDTREKQKELNFNNKKTNDKVISRTDPDASIYKRPNIPTQFAYKAHLSCDSKARVITACKVSPAEITDDKVVKELIESQPVKPKEVGGDSAYGTMEVYTYLYDKKIIATIPRKSRGKGRYETEISLEEFRYQKEKDVFICPAGKELKRKGRSHKWKWISYSGEEKICQRCKLREKCCGGKSARRVIRYERQEVLDFILRHLKTKEAKDTIKKRKVYIETVIAEAKNNHGLRKTNYRGIEKVEIQLLLTAATQNIKRLVKHYTENKEKEAKLREKIIPVSWLWN